MCSRGAAQQAVVAKGRLKFLDVSGVAAPAVFTEAWCLYVQRFQDCSDGRNGICGERDQWEPLQGITRGRFTVLHLGLPTLCEEEEIGVY